MKERQVKKLISRWAKTCKDRPKNPMQQIGLTARQRRALQASARYFAWFRREVETDRELEAIERIRRAVVAQHNRLWLLQRAPRLDWEISHAHDRGGAPMKFSILTVQTRNDNGTVDGNWVQGHMGTLETVQVVLDSYVASGRGTRFVAVDELPSPVPILTFWTDRAVLAEGKPQ